MTDLVDCDDITDVGILQELAKRFQSQEIYSSIGPIVIALNPYTSIARLYTSEILQQYATIHTNTISSTDLYHLESKQPHAWSVAASSYLQLVATRQPQAIVISGESGAGKTEATKLCLQLLSSIAASSDHSESVTDKQELKIEDKVLATNPVLESFGNSKTARNNNSSRFGKWLQIVYAENPSSHSNQLQLKSAFITQYLLEKSRVVMHASDERNYHIFYQMCAAGVLDLQPAASYRYMRYSKNMKIAGVDDRRDFEATRTSMINLGFGEKDQDAIFESLKAILLLGNLVFEESKDTAGDGANTAIISSDYTALLNQIGHLLGMTTEALGKALIGRSMTLRGESQQIRFTVSQAQDAVNAFAKELYGRLFGFIINQANVSLSEGLLSTTTAASASAADLSIGLLDIFGFEKFKSNSLEQLFINYANEKLQQYFITFVLKKEQELYTREGVDFESIVAIDNQDVLDLLESRPNGLFCRLDDEVKIPKATDDSFLKKVYGDHNNTKDPTRRFVKDVKMSLLQFEIKHFAGVIRYDALGFLEKNRDKLHTHLEELLTTSTKQRFREIITVAWRPDPVESTESAAAPTAGAVNTTTIATRFQGQLNQLMDVLQAAQPHFIKCIKPNNSKTEKLFEQETVLTQLRYSGVLEAIQVRKSGYPIRRTHESFWNAYWGLWKPLSRRQLLAIPESERGLTVLKNISLLSSDMVRAGQTLIFLKAEALRALDQRKVELNQFGAVKMQSVMRMKRAKNRTKCLFKLRDTLRESIANGQQQNEGNTEAITELIIATKNAKENDLPRMLIKEAERLLVRLHKVKDCLEKLDTFLRRDPATSILLAAEYVELRDLNNLAESLAIQSPVLQDVRARLAEIKVRAECALSLKAAIKDGDEDAVAVHLQAANELTTIHGSFCDEDILQAQQAMKVIQEDYSILEQVMNKLQTLLTRFQGADATVSNKDSRSWLKECMQQVKACWWQEDRGPQSRCVIPLTAILDLFRTLHEAWHSDDWEGSAIALQTLRPSSEELQIQYPVHESNSSALKRHLLVLRDLAALETKLLETEIFDHYVVPKFVRVIQEGSKMGPPGTIDPAAFDYENLAAAIDEARQQDWLGPAIIPTVEMLQRHLDLRGLFVDSRWSKIILHCESVGEEDRRKLIISEWLIKIQACISLDEAFTAEMDGFANESGAIFERDPLGNISPSLKRLQDSMEEDMNIMYAESIDRFCRTVLKNLIEAEDFEVEQLSEHTNIAEAVQMTQTLRMIASFVNIYSERLFAKSLPSLITKQLMKALEALIDLRRRFLAGQWTEIISFDEKTPLQLLSIESSDLDERCFGEGDLLVYDLLKQQILRLFVRGCELFIEKQVSETLTKNKFEFPPSVSENPDEAEEKKDVGKLSPKDKRTAATPKSPLEAALSSSQAVVSRIFVYSGELGADVTALMSFGSALLQARNVFASKTTVSYQEALHHLQQSFEEHKIVNAVQSMSESLLQEMHNMEKMIGYAQCIHAMSTALSSGGSTMRYFTSCTNSDAADDDIQYGGISPTVPIIKSKSLSFDMNASSNAIHAPRIADIKQILRQDKLIIQEESITWHELETAHNLAKTYQEDLESEDVELPAEFDHYLLSTEVMINIRKSMSSLDVTSALRLIVESVNGHSLRRKVPEIEAEIKTNLPALSNCGMIALCETALSRGQPTGPIGLFDFKTISLDLLEDAITMCEPFIDKSPRCLTVYNAVQFISDLRKAEKVGDWVEVSALLAKASAANFGRTQYTELCMPEIKRTVIERDNHDAIQQLQNAIINEEMPSANSSIDFNNVATKELITALGKVSNMPEDAKGAILSMVSILADSISKMRRAAKEKESYFLNLFGVVQDAFDGFRNDLDGLNRPMSSLQRKTMSFRGSTMQRTGTFHQKGGSKGNKDFDPSASLLGSPGPLQSPGPALKRTSIDEFVDLITSIKREIELVKHHFDLIDLEKELIEALSSDGIELDPTDGSIDLSKIQLEKLQAVLVKVEIADNSRLSLPPHMKQLRKVTAIMLDIRLAVRNDDWESLKVHIEETIEASSSLWPEYVRQEIKFVRAEQENRWIIKKLTEALSKDRLYGDLGDVPLIKVCNKDLIDCIHTAKTMKPRSEVGIKLLAAAEKMSILRGMIMINAFDFDAAAALNAIDWNAVKKMAKEITLEVQQRKCDAIVIQEARLIAELAEDRIICSAMELALSSGGVKGLPGRLDLSSLSTKELEKAFQLASRSSLKTQNAKSLLTVSRLVLKLRDFIRRAESSYVMGGLDETLAVWSSIRILLAEIALSRQTEPCWELCEQEIDLIQKHGLVEDLKTKLTQSAIEASHIYQDRHETAPVTDASLFDVGTAELKALNSSLEKLLAQSRDASFANDQFSEYIACGTSLCMFRSHIIDRNWQQLLVLSQSKELRNHLILVKQVKDELSWIMCELHNNLAMEIVRTALEGRPADTQKAADNTAGAAEANHEESSSLGAFHAQSYAERNQQLETALNEAKQYKITSKIANFWYECCSNMFQLRRSMAVKNNAVVATCLRWFKTNGKVCPQYVKMESQKAYELHQNDLLVTGLTRALSEGKPSGRRGDMNVTTIRTEAIESLLQQAKAIEPKFKEAEELISAAETVLDIRRALLTDNMNRLQEIIDQLSYEEHISMDIIEEVAVARAELDNRIAIKSLTDALASFEDHDRHHGAKIDLAFLSATSSSTASTAPAGADSANSTAQPQQQQLPDGEGSTTNRRSSTATSNPSILESFNVYSPSPSVSHSSSGSGGGGRRYSFANRSSTNIDPNTIDVDVLDKGLRLAQLHGVFSEKAAMLMRTVTMIKSLRIAMKTFDWPMVEEILNDAKFDETCGTRFDPLATREIQAIRSQLEMRAAIVDLSKALKIGWAKCSHGLVDTSTMNNDILSNAIERADHSIHEFGLSSASVDVNDPSIPSAPGSKSGYASPSKRRVTFQDQVESGAKRTQSISKQLNLLMDSAKLVLKIRELLAVGNMEEAGSFAEEALASDLHYSVVEELRLYAKEINAALVSMRAAESLRSIAVDGQVLPLQTAIQTALITHDIHLGSDLGLICTLTRAQKVYEQLLFLREQLTNLQQEHELARFESLLTLSDQIRYGDEELITAKQRYIGLQQFQTRCELLQQAWVFAADERVLFRRLLEYATEWNVTNHPYCRRTQLLLKLSALTVRAVRLSDAIRQPEQAGHFAVITQTLKIKRQFLMLSSSHQKYRLELFSKLRLPSEYALRMTIMSEELRRGMLMYSEQPLPTSLTNLPPPFAALAVVIFTSCLRGLERNFFTNMEVILYRVVNVGRRSPVLRDEILLLLVKQMRGNPDLKSIQRLWQLLIACLYHFPPSQVFENHLELFLLHCADGQESSVGVTGLFPMAMIPYAHRALRYLHHTIFRYGYDHPIPTTEKEQRHVLLQWFEQEHYDPLQPVFLTVQQAALTSAADSELLQIQVGKLTGRKANMALTLEDLIAIDLSNDAAFASSQSPSVEPSPSGSSQNLNIFSQSLSPGALTAVTGGFSSLAASAAAITKVNVKAAAQAAAAATAANAAAASSTPSVNANTGMMHGSGGSSNNLATVTMTATPQQSNTQASSAVESASIVRIRGIRENWIHRFRAFNNKSTSRDGGHMTRSKFSYGLALTLSSSKSDMDKLDRDIFYFLLLGRKPSLAHRGAIYRECIHDRHSFHFTSEEEMINSKLRRNWLEQHMIQHNQHQAGASSELFFAQMQSSDMLGYAERFWDAVILRMSKECVNFPFLRWDRDDVTPTSDMVAGEENERSSGASTPVSFDHAGGGSKAPARGLTSRRSFSNLTAEGGGSEHVQQQPPSILRKAFSQQMGRAGKNATAENEQDDVSIAWEIYREVLLTGMKLLLLQYQQQALESKDAKQRASGNKLLSLQSLSAAEINNAQQIVDLSSDGEVSLISLIGSGI